LVWVNPVHAVLVNAANTVAILNVDFHESIITPMTAPRVLYFPVVLVTLGIFFSIAFIHLVLAAYPPVLDIAFSYGLARGPFGVADERHTMVDSNSVFSTVGVFRITTLF